MLEINEYEKTVFIRGCFTLGLLLIAQGLYILHKYKTNFGFIPLILAVIFLYIHYKYRKTICIKKDNKN